MKLNKTLIAALVLGIGLTGCDNMVDDGNSEKNNDSNTSVVDENKDETKNTADTENEETQSNENDKSTKTDDEKLETEADEDKDEKTTEDDATEESDTDEDSTSEEKSTGGQSKKEQIESLEQAIFDNRSAARAVELLFQLSPEVAGEHEDELNALLDDSNDLLEKAQTALDQLKEQ